jgi:hypothetical protein
VVSLLILDVPNHRRQISASEADHPVASLPAELISTAQAVHLMGAGPLDLPDELTRADLRLNLDGEMEVSRGATDGEELDPAELAGVLGDIVMERLLKEVCDERPVLVAMPIEVQVDVVKRVTLVCHRC